MHDYGLIVQVKGKGNWIDSSVCLVLVVCLKCGGHILALKCNVFDRVRWAHVKLAWPRKFFSVKVADDFFLKVFGFVFRFVFC
jgi:hypothetical protein